MSSFVCDECDEEFENIAMFIDHCYIVHDKEEKEDVEK